MKKLILVISLVIFAMMLSAQELSIKNPVNVTDDVWLELIESNDYSTLIKYQKISEEGEVSQEGILFNGKPDGVWKMYGINGAITTVIFKNGDKVSLEAVIDGRKTKVFYVNNKPSKSIAYFD